MFDIDLIKKNYSKMADQQIIELANSEGTIISHEAFIVLKREFIKRNLDKQLIKDVESKRLESKKGNIQDNILKEEQDINQHLWDYTIQQKYENKTDEEIIQGLIAKGVSIENARNAVNDLETAITKASKETSNKIFRGMVFIGIAGIVAYLSYTVWNNWLWVFLPIVFIIRLLGPFLRYFEQNEKYNFILKNIRKK
jgi:hypothetical protein